MRELENIDLLKESIVYLELPEIETLKYLNNLEPIIYLCGKSSTGKTTFLNALFNMKRDEMFTSTNISTKTEFRFKYGLEEKIEESNGNIIKLPDNYQDRKSLFKSLNEKDETYTITLYQEALKNRTIVDIPGVFDFKRNELFSNRMLDEADVIYFFTPCRAKINESEFELLNKISQAGIPIVVLFTMGDITDVDEGITRKNMPKLVEKRLDYCFKSIEIAHYQIISSNDYYKNKGSHGINILKQHIGENDFKYKKIAEENRLKRSLEHYLDLIEKKLINLKNDSDNYKSLVKRENQLWYSSEKIILDKEKEKTIHKLNIDLDWLEKNCKEQILSSFSADTTHHEQARRFETNWNKFWNTLNDDFDFLQNINTNPPPFSDDLFEKISFDLEKIKEFFDNETEKEKNINNQIEEDKNRKEGLDKFSQLIEKIKNLFENKTWGDFLSLGIKAGINIKNIKLLWKKLSYLKEINSIINQAKDDALLQTNNEFELRIAQLENQRDSKIENSMSENPAKEFIEKYKIIFNKLKNI